ncbi:hypothetical protein DVH05_018240 [Phytophthora capsici]|nr:hypothetical protein DVH05_018240 [Phytophthora capsici]
MAPVGRPRIKGKGAKPKQFKRVAVSYAYKLQVLRFLDHYSMAQTITNFFPEVAAEKGKAKKRLLYSWKAVREVIEAKCANGAREHSRARQKGMGTTLSASSEEQLVA